MQKIKEEDEEDKEDEKSDKEDDKEDENLKKNEEKSKEMSHDDMKKKCKNHEVNEKDEILNFSYHSCNVQN